VLEISLEHKIILKKEKTDMVTTSIWRDTYYTTNKDVLTYYIKDADGNTLFAGRAYRLPSASTLKININSICKNYLSNDIGPLLERARIDAIYEAPSTKGVGTFYLYDADTDSQLETYKFLYDWSYTLNWNGNNNIVLSKPINGRIAGEMYAVYSTVKYDDIYNNLYGGYDANVYNALDCTDAEFGLYYLNSQGGWDAFLFEGKAEVKDTITQFTTEKSYNNTTLDFETYRYVSEVSRSYTLHTGWLTDEQSENFAKNLVGSNTVYLHNLKTDTIIPAIITDSEVIYKNMKYNSGKMSTYTINIKESQNKLRQ
jgi:hypothetical protein